MDSELRANILRAVSEILHRHFVAGRRATVDMFAQSQGDLIDYVVQERAKAAREALEKAHRAGGLHDYDNETDAYIDELLDGLQSQEREGRE